MGKIISIIIATYNAESTLKRCLDSIVCQLNEHCELIVVDGGSTDRTNEIISSYSNYITYTISEKDEGIYDAWNKGIKASNGKWICFIGADDMLCDEVLASYIHLIHLRKDIDEYDYISARLSLYTETGEWIKDVGLEAKWNLMKYGMSAAHPMSLHNKKNLFDVVGLYNINYKICADYELLLRKREKLKFLFLPQVVVKMRIGGASFSVKGVRETFLIRRNCKTISQIENYYKYFSTLLGLKVYRLRHSMRNLLRKQEIGRL